MQISNATVNPYARIQPGFKGGAATEVMKAAAKAAPVAVETAKKTIQSVPVFITGSQAAPISPVRLFATGACIGTGATTASVTIISTLKWLWPALFLLP